MSLVEHERLAALSEYLKKHYPKEFDKGNEVEVAIHVIEKMQRKCKKLQKKSEINGK